MNKVYLCSRVAEDARSMNNEVALALIKAGFEVYIPHAAPHNNMNASDLEIYTQDLAEMKKADFCVAVGRLGVDCAFEVGWFTGRAKFIYWYLPTPLKDRHPMFFELKPHTFDSIQVMIQTIKDELGG
jgi:nucleoside 2-deoxyribosyltransferase